MSNLLFNNNMIEALSKNNYNKDDSSSKKLSEIYNLPEDEELKKYEMKQQLLKFNDNNPNFS